MKGERHSETFSCKKYYPWDQGVFRCAPSQQRRRRPLQELSAPKRETKGEINFFASSWQQSFIYTSRQQHKQMNLNVINNAVVISR